MNSPDDRSRHPQDDEWMRMWQGHMASDEDPERVARTIMAQVWKFDHMLFWRNAREYAAGLVLLVVFVSQLAIGHDRSGALIGLGSVGFVLGYLWWKHRGLQPLDPSADAIAYRAALLARIDDQIRLLRGITWWYLLPLSLPPLWQAGQMWKRSPWIAAFSLALVAAVYAFLRWLNVTAGVRVLLNTRAKIESMFPEDGR